MAILACCGLYVSMPILAQSEGRFRDNRMSDRAEDSWRDRYDGLLELCRRDRAVSLTCIEKTRKLVDNSFEYWGGSHWAEREQGILKLREAVTLSTLQAFDLNRPPANMGSDILYSFKVVCKPTAGAGGHTLIYEDGWKQSGHTFKLRYRRLLN